MSWPTHSAHSRSVFHRDLKPENVLLSAGHAVVADFGIAKAIAASTLGGSATAAATNATATGVAIGTPAYMAPEQAAADPAADHRVDLYALGVIAYELIAGVHPFAGRSPHQLLAAHLSEAPEPLSSRRPDVPAPLASLVMRLLAKNPADHPASAAAVVSEIDAVATPATGMSSQPTLRRRRGVELVVGATVLAALVLAAFFAVRNRSPVAVAQRDAGAVVGTTASKSVAVLPLINAAGDTADAYFAEGMTDEVTGALARVPGLRVTSRSAASLIDPRTAVRDAGQRLGVTTVLAGRVRRQATQLRLTVELVDVATGVQLWSQTYERDGKDVFRVQDEIAHAIASALSVQLAGNARLAVASTENPEAHDLVLRARYQSNLYTAESLQRAIGLYGRALALDSTYAAAWSGLAEAWIRTADDFIAPVEAVPHIRVAVTRALALDSMLADAHGQHASLLGYYDRDFVAADREFVRALTIDSTLSGASADYTNILLAIGQPDSGAAVLRRALRIDPLSPYLAHFGPLSFIFLGRMAEARAACGVAAEVGAALGHRCRTHLMYAEGQDSALIDTLQAEAVPSPWTHALLAAAFARSGRMTDARREAAAVESAARERYLDERIPAGMYAAMGGPRSCDRVARAWVRFERRDPGLYECRQSAGATPTRPSLSGDAATRWSTRG